ncbi:hypothetical protein [Nonomuraea sp. NPDC001831]|uniref:hypothetical protein n=1 Tax=Nonomuraea sp. NPDC001831 TaxID=3364340 RepID=UPI003693BD0F
MTPPYRRDVESLQAIRGDGIYGGALVATKMASGALEADAARAWAVHERAQEPDDEGHLWITREPLTGSAGASEEGVSA